MPTRVVAEMMNSRTARVYWFSLFRLGRDSPEALISGKESERLQHFFADWYYDRYTIEGADFDAHARAYKRPRAVRGAMWDCQANAEGVAQDLKDAEVNISCPTIALWGRDFCAVGGMLNMKAIWP